MLQYHEQRKMYKKQNKIKNRKQNSEEKTEKNGLNIKD